MGSDSLVTKVSTRTRLFLLACMMHPEGCSGHESLCQILEELNLSNCVIVPQKPHAVLTTPQQGWQLLPQSVCDDETSNTWSVTLGENRKPSLPTHRLCKLTLSCAPSFFLVPGPLCLPWSIFSVALTRSGWGGLTLKHQGSKTQVVKDNAI